jgi:hypothetical protein
MRRRTNEAPTDESTQRVWTLRDGVPVSLPISTGSTDGTRTVVTSGDLEPGLLVIVDFDTASSGP